MLRTILKRLDDLISGFMLPFPGEVKLDKCKYCSEEILTKVISSTEEYTKCLECGHVFSYKRMGI